MCRVNPHHTWVNYSREKNTSRHTELLIQARTSRPCLELHPFKINNSGDHYVWLQRVFLFFLVFKYGPLSAGSSKKHGHTITHNSHQSLSVFRWDFSFVSMWEEEMGRGGEGGPDQQLPCLGWVNKSPIVHHLIIFFSANNCCIQWHWHLHIKIIYYISIFIFIYS